VTAAKKTPGGPLVELAVVLAIAVGLALLLQAFLVKPFKIPSASMVPTLTVGQRVLVDRVGERLGDPQVGDVIVFHPPAGATAEQAGRGRGAMCGVSGAEGEPCARPTSRASEQNFVKRVVAGPGDTVAVVDSHVIRNGARQPEPFVQATCPGGTSENFPRAIRVPRGHWFVMGDNRQCSQDSRYWGPVPGTSIIGGAFATYWPPRRVGAL
jgi:signal peptidase I